MGAPIRETAERPGRRVQSEPVWESQELEKEKEKERPPPNSLVQYARPLWPTDSLFSAGKMHKPRMTRQAGTAGYPDHLHS